jgi:hypothetical protein
MLGLGGCLDSGTPTTPTCIGALEIELSDSEVVVGETVTATADHQIEQCLIDLRWSVMGDALDFDVAEGLQATFDAVDSGTALIRVENRDGNFGIHEVDVADAPDEDGGAARKR